MEGYAVSAQCMALVRDNCLVPTRDAPELGYVRESTDKQFVPDVYYKVSVHFPLYFRFIPCLNSRAELPLIPRRSNPL